MYKIIVGIISCILLTGCWSKTPSSSTKETYEAVHPEVAGAAVPSRSMDTIRQSESVRVYQTGRYVDASDANVMHESSTLYVIADSPQWNTAPNYPPLDPRHNRQVTVSAPLNADLQLQLVELQKTTKVMLQLGQEIVASRKAMDSAKSTLSTTIKQQETDRKMLEKQLRDTQKRLEQLAKEIADIKLQKGVR